MTKWKCRNHELGCSFFSLVVGKLFCADTLFVYFSLSFFGVWFSPVSFNMIITIIFDPIIILHSRRRRRWHLQTDRPSARRIVLYNKATITATEWLHALNAQTTSNPIYGHLVFSPLLFIVHSLIVSGGGKKKYGEKLNFDSRNDGRMPKEIIGFETMSEWREWARV